MRFAWPPGEDLWHAYNLVREGDRVEATTFRKVQRDTGTGGESEKVKLKLLVVVEAVEYDAEGGRQLGWPPSIVPAQRHARQCRRGPRCLLHRVAGSRRPARP
jgi:hypothetical protein